MDLLLSLFCGAMGGMAIGGLPSRWRIGQFIGAGLGLVGGWLGAEALDYLALGLAHSPAPAGALDRLALTLQIAATALAGMGLVALVGQLRRLIRR